MVVIGSGGNGLVSFISGCLFVYLAESIGGCSCFKEMNVSICELINGVKNVHHVLWLLSPFPLH